MQAIVSPPLGLAWDEFGRWFAGGGGSPRQHAARVQQGRVAALALLAAIAGAQPDGVRHADVVEHSGVQVGQALDILGLSPVVAPVRPCREQAGCGFHLFRAGK